MSFEHLKSITLLFLVSLSIFLTWQLWTFQPDLATLENPEYISSEPIGEQRDLADIVYPETILFYANDQQTFIDRRDPLFREFYEQLLGSEFDFFFSLSNTEFESLLTVDEGIEIVYPSTVPIDVVLRKFQIDQAEHSLPLLGVDRLLLFYNDRAQAVQLRLISLANERVIQATTNFSIADFQGKYLAKAEQFPTFFVYEGANHGHSRNIYLPEERLGFDSLSFTSTFIDPERFKQILFSDPSYVKHYRQNDGEDSFTDGNRLINVVENRNFMYYINPVLGDNQGNSNKTIVASSFDFLNGHSGWTDDYMLSDWNSEAKTEEIRYRLNIMGLPVYSMIGRDLAYIYVSRSGNQISRYIRPLINIDDDPIDAKREIELRSGLEVIEFLEGNSSIETAEIEDIKVGYELVKRNSIITLLPHWFMKSNGRWTKIAFNEVGDDEGDD